ncbi:MAG: hypothetical protein QM831_30110 [Kofleriaceae bacterium]
MRALLVIALLAGCRSNDDLIAAARARVLAISADDAAKFVAACGTMAKKPKGLLLVREWPALPITPTTIEVGDTAVTLAWWNNDHREDDRSHPGFEVICTETTTGRELAPGLWYRDNPPAD